MNPNTFIVVTSIFPESEALTDLAEAARTHACPMIVIGDGKGPETLAIPGASYHGLTAQSRLNLRYARQGPINHYARKNVGYLLALRDGAELILEQDDDGIAMEDFWLARRRDHSLPTAVDRGWFNAYRYFSDQRIWPRGFPLEQVKDAAPPLTSLPKATVDCPIQSGLVDQDPDVDAVYRMTAPLPVDLRQARLALSRGAWCPFNSQNTLWWRETFPLLYLPATCSSRMTDVWRSFVAQRIAWENDWVVLFHGPTIRQERKPHDLAADFAEETAGYLHNRELCAALAALPLRKGRQWLFANMESCYSLMARRGWLGDEELTFLSRWRLDFEDLAR